MAKVSSPQCQGCGAPIRVETGRRVYDCRFCGRSNVLDSAGAAQEAAAPGQTPPNAAAFVAVGIALAVSLLGALFFVMGSTDGGPGRIGGDRFQWDGVAGPVLVDGADGAALIVGRIRRDGEMHVAAFDAASLELKWQTGSLGDWGERFQQTFLAAGAGRLAITHPDSTLTIHGLEDGEAISLVALSDRAIAVCSPPDEPNLAWFAIADLRDVSLDLSSGEIEPASRPEGCADPRDFFSDCRPPPLHGAECRSGGRDLPQSTEAQISSTLVLGDDGVALGYRDPGTATPVLMGFDPSDLSPRWTRRLDALHSNVRPHGVDLVELAHGRYYVEYGLENNSRRLACFDARTGTLIFDTAYPDADKVTGATLLLVRGGRIYIPRWTWLHILDAETGGHISTLGHWM